MTAGNGNKLTIKFNHAGEKRVAATIAACVATPILGLALNSFRAQHGRR